MKQHPIRHAHTIYTLIIQGITYALIAYHTTVTPKATITNLAQIVGYSIIATKTYGIIESAGLMLIDSQFITRELNKQPLTHTIYTGICDQLKIDQNSMSASVVYGLTQINFMDIVVPAILMIGASKSNRPIDIPTIKHAIFTSLSVGGIAAWTAGTLYYLHLWGAITAALPGDNNHKLRTQKYHAQKEPKKICTSIFVASNMLAICSALYTASSMVEDISDIVAILEKSCSICTSQPR